MSYSFLEKNSLVKEIPLKGEVTSIKEQCLEGEKLMSASLQSLSSVSGTFATLLRAQKKNPSLSFEELNPHFSEAQSSLLVVAKSIDVFSSKAILLLEKYGSPKQAKNSN